MFFRSFSICGALCLTSLLAVTSSGCATIYVDLPDAFLRLAGDETNAIRAITPSEARIWIRDQDAPPGAELSFWREALTRDLVHGRGYTVLEENDIKDGNGKVGLELLCEATLGGIPHRYLLSVFVYPTSLPWLLDDTVRTVEYVAEKEDFDTHLAAVRKSVKGLK